MKWFIGSDIHGSEYYCRKMAEAFEREKADRILLLGDILYHGPRNDLPKDYNPKSVIEILNSYKNIITSVRGNCDTEVDQMVLKFPVLADYALISDGDVNIFATHGHIYNEEKLPPLRDGDILLCGHTHIPACTENERYMYMNPGSVSIPKEGSHHGYMILKDNVFTWKDMEGRQINEKNIYGTNGGNHRVCIPECPQ